MTELHACGEAHRMASPEVLVWRKMNRPAGISALALAFCSLGLAAQGAQSKPDAANAPYAVTPVPDVSSGVSYKSRPVPSLQNLSPFQSETPQSSSDKLIEFRSQSQMTEPDRGLADGAQASLREDATLAGIELGQGKWTYQQLECQALPGHLFLLYKGENGAGDISLFSAAIARAGNGQVRIIPIQRRGFSLFSPAPVNPLTIAAFNRIRSSEPGNADWLATALCYAALTGAHPETASTPDKSPDASLSLSFPPTLEVGNYGESTVRFVDVASPRQPKEWALTFNGKGLLLKVTNSAVPAYTVKPIPALPALQSSVPSAPSATSAESSQ
jgi:hypothetical protein